VKCDLVVFGYGSMTNHGIMISDYVEQVGASPTMKVFHSYYSAIFFNQHTLLKTNPAQDVLNEKANGTTHQPKQRLQQQHTTAVTPKAA